MAIGTLRALQLDKQNNVNKDIAERIEDISTNLASCSAELLTIQQELESRIEFVENLKSEADIAENVISLTNDQVNAIQAKLNQELNANSGKSLFQNIILSVSIFILGLIIHPIFRIIKNKLTKTTKNDTSALSTTKYSDEQLEMAVKLLDLFNQSK